MKTFIEYQLHRVKQDHPRKLKLLSKMLTQSGLFVDDRFDDEDSHIFVSAIPKPEEFDGIRIYFLGNVCCYRVQKMKDTEPYGNSYLLDLQKMFDDILIEKGQKASNKDCVEALIERVGKELRKFFANSIDDEEDYIQSQIDSDRGSDAGNAMIAPAYGTDYSSHVYSVRNG